MELGSGIGAPIPVPLMANAKVGIPVTLMLVLSRSNALVPVPPLAAKDHDTVPVEASVSPNRLIQLNPSGWSTEVPVEKKA